MVSETSKRVRVIVVKARGTVSEIARNGRDRGTVMLARETVIARGARGARGSQNGVGEIAVGPNGDGGRGLGDADRKAGGRVVVARINPVLGHSEAGRRGAVVTSRIGIAVRTCGGRASRDLVFLSPKRCSNAWTAIKTVR